MKKLVLVVVLFDIFTLYLLYSKRYNFAGKIKKTQKCQIQNIQPFDLQVLKYFKRQKYQSCGPVDLLTYVTVKNNTATLHINKKMARKYHNFTCRYRKIKQMQLKFDPELTYKVPPFRVLESSARIDFDFVLVECWMQNKMFYSNTHAPIILKKNIIQRQELMKNRDEAFSVLIIGIDSMSRLNFLRSLPQTHKFLTKNNWISFEAYNKVGDNTFPNLMALLTGLDEAKATENCISSLTDCPLLFYEYQKLGYATAYAEDEPRLGNFLLSYWIFDNPPTDYYFAPYFRHSEKLIKTRRIYGVNYCTGQENTGERVLNMAKNFAKTLQNRPSFGLFWINSFSHNNLNLASSMDSKLRDFFQNISDSGILKNTFVFFLSDHGLRVGPFRQTPMGWLEERLPFIYVWVPMKFQIKFRRKFHNFKQNTNQLMSPYHLHMTLQDILVVSERNFELKPSQGCPMCQSLFESFEDRSCEEAGIDYHWCTCRNYTNINNRPNLVQKASKRVLEYINNVIPKGELRLKCLKYTLAKIISARISHDHKYILLVLETSPKAIFETTVLYKPGSEQIFHVEDGISRLDSYEELSKCIHDRFLKKFCYCVQKFQKQTW